MAIFDGDGGAGGLGCEEVSGSNGPIYSGDFFCMGRAFLTHGPRFVWVIGEQQMEIALPRSVKPVLSRNLPRFLTFFQHKIFDKLWPDLLPSELIPKQIKFIMAKTTAVAKPRTAASTQSGGRKVTSAPASKSQRAAPASQRAPLAAKPAGKPSAPAPAKSSAAAAAKAAVVPAAMAQRPVALIPAEVDPLLAGGQPPMKLVGGLDRDAQLPTTLVPKADLPAAVPLTVHAQAVPGAAHHGNAQPANILVLVSCGGWPVVDLNEDHFSVMEHFEVPGQTTSFSNNVVSFRNNGSGAYLLQVKPIGNTPWVGGQHLAQILVSSPDERHGQTAAKLIIR